MCNNLQFVSIVQEIVFTNKILIIIGVFSAVLCNLDLLNFHKGLSCRVRQIPLELKLAAALQIAPPIQACPDVSLFTCGQLVSFQFAK